LPSDSRSDLHDLDADMSLPSDPAQEPEAVAHRYRWKIDGEWTSWHFSDASQKHPSLNSLQEQPLYTRSVSLDREAVAQALLDRFIQRGKCRTIGGGSSFPDGTKVSSLPASYKDDFFADADAIIALIEGRT
jgi:hypothetical protein